MHLDLDPYFVHIVEPKLGIQENLSPYRNFVEDHALRAAQIVGVQQASALVLAGVLALLHPLVASGRLSALLVLLDVTPAPVASNFLGLASYLLPDFASAATYLVAYASLTYCPR